MSEESTPLPWEQEEASASPETKTAGGGTARRGSPMALGGKRVNADEYPPRPFPNGFPGGEVDGENGKRVYQERFVVDRYTPETDVDYTDLSQLNMQINRARRALFETNRMLAQQERAEARKEYAYRTAHARVMVGLSGGSEKQRTALADITTEKEYGELLVARTLVREITSQVRALRTELDVLTVMSHNLRAQISLQ